MSTKRSTSIRDGRYVQGGKVDRYTRLLGWWERRVLPKDASDISLQITSKYHQRPELLAFDLYGRAGLMWLILQFNNIVDVNVEFVEGAEILVPTLQRVQSELLTKST